MKAETSNMPDTIEVKFNRKTFLFGDSGATNKHLPVHKIDWHKYYPATISEVGSFWDLDVTVDGETIPAHREEVYPYGPLNLDKWIRSQRNEQWKARIKLRIAALTEELEALEKSDAEAR